jgi:hypothetical protein
MVNLYLSHQETYLSLLAVVELEQQQPQRHSVPTQLVAG